MSQSHDHSRHHRTPPTHGLPRIELLMTTMLKTLAARSRLARSAVVRRITDNSGAFTRSALPLVVRPATVRTTSETVRPSMRLFSTSSDNAAAAVDDENRFLEMAEETLEQVVEWIDGIEEMLDDSDVTLSQGVLKIDLGAHGTWVLNRQIPNRQIWWSSPISGPRRYEFDAETGAWLSTREKAELFECLQQEICDATGISIHS
ncbi:hypothetical protein PINS_up018989 [Pythium insidiosum]|nr:hypothetical protein PINS_up018989 [Pythium insidiosum]